MVWPWARWSARFRGASEDEQLAALPGADPFASLEEITARLEALRADAKLSAADAAVRLAVLESAARRCYRDATRRYLRGLRTQPPETLATWGQTVETCLTRLAHAHQSLVVPWSKPRSGLVLPADEVTAVLARSMRLAAAVLKWSHLRHASEPIGVWADLCRLYAMAEARACARTPVALVPGLELRASVEREFLEACMLCIAQPAGLRPEQVDIAERAAHFCAPGFALSSAGDPRFSHLVDIEGGDAPRRREAGAAVSPSLRSFGLDGGERLLAALLRLVESDRIPPRSFGMELEKDLVTGTLRHLQSCWHQPDAGAPAHATAGAGEAAIV